MVAYTTKKGSHLAALKELRVGNEGVVSETPIWGHHPGNETVVSRYFAYHLECNLTYTHDNSFRTPKWTHEVEGDRQRCVVSNDLDVSGSVHHEKRQPFSCLEKTMRWK